MLDFILPTAPEALEEQADALDRLVVRNLTCVDGLAPLQLQQLTEGAGIGQRPLALSTRLCKLSTGGLVVIGPVFRKHCLCDPPQTRELTIRHRANRVHAGSTLVPRDTGYHSPSLVCRMCVGCPGRTVVKRSGGVGALARHHDTRVVGALHAQLARWQPSHQHSRQPFAFATTLMHPNLRTPRCAVCRACVRPMRERHAVRDRAAHVRPTVFPLQVRDPRSSTPVGASSLQRPLPPRWESFMQPRRPAAAQGESR
jgi:hypothetical protein